MSDRHEIDSELDALGEAVRRAFAGESLSSEQRRRHLGRLRSRLGGRARSALWSGPAEPAGPGGRFSRMTRVPRDESDATVRRPVFQLVSGIVAVILVGAILIAVFEGTVRRDADESSGVGASLLPRARGWVYPGARVAGGGQLAFVSNVADVPQIAVVNADGSGLEVLTTDAATHWGPDWSPDGRQLLWSSDARGAAQVYSANADGGELRQRSTFFDNRDPLWSPDGDWIAFVSTRDQRTDIYVVPAAGGREVSITTGIGLGSQANLAWSPDSRFIAFENEGDIWVVGRDGQNLRRLTRHPATDSGPVWSPDGTRIAFFADRGGNSEIYVVNADGTDLTNLTKTPDDEFKPAWSPDGWSIAYLRAERKVEPDYETTLWSMGANGADQRRLGDFTGYGLSAPAWSPDSRQIAVIAAPEGSDLSDGTIADGRLVVVAANGTGQRVIHEQAAGLGRPAWRPLWWPEATSSDSNAPDPLVPHLALVPDEGSCASQVVAHGSGFEPGAVVSLYGAPDPGNGFAPAAKPVIVAADGSFEIPLDLTRLAGCAGDALTGGPFHIGAAIEPDQHHGAALADLFATAVFTVHE